jgi:hypothetical protein
VLHRPSHFGHGQRNGRPVDTRIKSGHDRIEKGALNG